MPSSNAFIEKKIDSFEFESRFSTENRIKYDEIHDSSVTYDEMRPFISKLPPREIDLVELYYKDRINQKNIAKMFGVTQGAISSRLSRAKRRLRFLRDLPKISGEEILRDLGNSFEPVEIEIIKYMMQTTCQSETATLINKLFNLTEEKKKMTQVKVRHRFEKCLKFLEDNLKETPSFRRYHELLKLLKENLYLLHEVKLPHFDRGSSVMFSMTY